MIDSDQPSQAERFWAVPDPGGGRISQLIMALLASATAKSR